MTTEIIYFFFSNQPYSVTGQFTEVFLPLSVAEALSNGCVKDGEIHFIAS